jgi:hypothetical protein
MKNNITSIAISIAVVVAALLFAGAYKYKFKNNETITVTGLAEKNFTSDLIVWRGTYERKTTELREAYRLIKNDEDKVREYLKGNGIADSEIVFSSITLSKEFSDTYNQKGDKVGSVFTGYKLSQQASVESKNIDKVELVSREVTKLIESGIEINSYEPSYFYTKLSELKIDLLAKASADAKKRAETIAENSGSSLGKIKTASMGVFQITGQNSNEDFSEGGTFNTSSKNKKASITVRIEYAVN